MKNFQIVEIIKNFNLQKKNKLTDEHPHVGTG